MENELSKTRVHGITGELCVCDKSGIIPRWYLYDGVEKTEKGLSFYIPEHE